jgi:hypothetical protein
LGEEAEASSSYANGLAMGEYGQKDGALLAAIEHRFYGKSQPLGTLEDLSLLSVDEGLADFAAVIEMLKAKYNVSHVVVFGCSYIGAGAAWFRSRYSHLLVGAVSSSPPVHAVADFNLYLEQVGETIAKQWGQVCDTNIRTGFAATIKIMLSDPQELQQTFNLCAAPASPEDISTFVMSLAGTVMSVVQYDFEFGNNVMILKKPFSYFLSFIFLLECGLHVRGDW